MPRRVRPDDSDACPLADTGILKGGGEASHSVGRLAHAPLLAGGRVHQGQPVRMATRRRQEGARGRIVVDHEAWVAFAAMAA